MAKSKRGALLFLGTFPSRFTGDLVDAYLGDHGNDKTGPVKGLIVMPSGVRSVFEVFASPAQASVCGECVHRGKGSGGAQTCYVINGSNIAMGVTGLLANRGELPLATDKQISALVRGATVRLAIFGDSAALPLDVWARLEQLFDDNAWQVLGYTHGHTVRGFDFVAHLRATHQASCETAEHVASARAAGFGTFRARNVGDLLVAGEAMCPSDKVITSKSMRGARGMTCGECGKCDGKSGDSRAIYRHESGGLRTMVKAYAAGTLSIAIANRRAA